MRIVFLYKHTHTHTQHYVWLAFSTLERGRLLKFSISNVFSGRQFGLREQLTKLFVVVVGSGGLQREQPSRQEVLLWR